MPRTYVPVRERAARPPDADLDDVPAQPGGVVSFVQTLIDDGVLPELTAHQRAFLEMFDGGRPPLRGPELAYAAQRAGRRLMRTMIAAHAILDGQDVRFAAATGEQAGRARDDAVHLLDEYCRITGAERPTLTLTIVDEVPA
jgi:hypothetical protein